MNKLLLFGISFLCLLTINLNAQCDLEVEIKANPGAEICLGESVTLTAVTNQEVEIPEDCEIVTDVNCEVGSVPFTATLGGGTTVNAQGASLPDVFGDINEGQVRSQIIYRADELIASGFEGGKIKGMAMELATILGTGELQNLEIQMACTPEDDFASSFITGLSTVFDKKSYTLSSGFNTFNFDRAFIWNGKDNIVIQICIHAPDGSPGNFKNYTRDKDMGYPVMRAAKRILATTNCDITDNARNTTQRPNTQFLTCKPQLKDFTYSWTPVGGVSDPSARNPTATPTSDQTYTVEVYETANPGCVASTSLTVTVIDPGNFTPSANTPLCEGDALILSSNTAADGYLWVGPDGYASTDPNPVINNVGLNNEGEYTVFIDIGFCKASRTVNVDVESVLNPGTALPDPVLCNNEAPINLYSLLQGYDQNATSAWSDDDASGVLAGSTITPTNIPNAVLPKTFDFTYSLSNSCGTQSETVSITFNPAPNAGDDGTVRVCNLDDISVNLFDSLQGTPDLGGTWSDFNNTGALQPGGIVNMQGFASGSYSFYYKVTGPGACKSDSARVVVRVENYKVAGTGSQTRVCKGTTINLNDLLNDNPDAGGTWIDKDGSGGLQNAFTGVFNSSNVAPGTYTFDYFIDNVVPCPDETATVVVVVTKKPEIFNATTFCNASETFYQVRFEVRDGNPNTLEADVYTATNTYGFTLQQQGGLWIFTSDLIPEGDEVFIDIWDADNCGTSSYNIRKRCGCITDAGVISKVPTVDVCEGSFYTVNYLGGFIDDGNDIYEFILHDSPTSTIGNIIDRNRTGTFGYVQGMVEGQVYYISVVAGNKKPTAFEVDLTDDCLDVRDGQPVRFIVLPDIDLSVSPDTACIGSNVTLSASSIPAGITYEWQGPGVTSPNPSFQIFGLAKENVGTYSFIINKSICTASFDIELLAHKEPLVQVPNKFTVCADVRDSIPVVLDSVNTATARFQTESFQLIDLPIVKGQNFLHQTFNADETYKLLSVTYPKGCTKIIDQDIDIVLEQAPDLSFELISQDIICSSADPKAQVQFSINPSTAQGNIVYEVNGFQFPDEPLVGNDSILDVPALSAGENTFKIRRYFSAPKSCLYSLDFGEVKFFNYEEPQVSFNVNNNKICRGDIAFIPVSVTAADSVVVVYSINGQEFEISTLRDTLLPVQENLDFTFSIDSVYYKGGNGCGKFIGLEQIFEVKDPINFNVTPVKNNCAGEAQGKLLLSADGVDTRFSLDGSTYFTKTAFENLPSGDYTVFAKAESGCISVRNVEIENKSNIEINVQYTNTTCGNDNGTLMVDIDKGSEPYHLFIGGEEYEDEELLIDLPEGFYPIYAYDNLACELRDTIYVEPSQGVDFTFTVNGPLSCDFPDAGKIFVTPTGGSGNYLYQINNQPAQTDSLFSGLYAQFYNLTVTDAQDGCVKKKRARIQPKVPFLLNAKILKGLTCSYSKDGRVEAVTEQNATTYLCSLDGVNYSTQKLFSNVGQGTFTLFAKEMDGCFREQAFSFKMIAPSEIQTNVVYSEDVDCWNGKDGQVALEASGGNGSPFTFKNAAKSGGFNSSAVFQNLGQGLYEFVARDTKGCLDTIAVKLNGPDTVVVTVTKLDSTGGLATILVEATNTHLVTLFSIDGVNFTTNNIFTGLEPGSYTIYVRDQLGCETRYTYNLTLVGISEFSQESFSVYPNPFENGFNIQLLTGAASDAKVHLSGIDGKQHAVNISVDGADKILVQPINDLPAGMYILKVNKAYKRIIKH